MARTDGKPEVDQPTNYATRNLSRYNF